MKILGVRNFSGGFRYAIIDGNADNYSCVNLNSENRIIIPTGLMDTEIYSWYKKEIDRIVDNNVIEQIAIKRNENTPSKYSTLQQVMFFDCITTMVALDKNINISSFVYRNLGQSSKTVKNFTENLTGKTNKYWDEKIADAIFVAIKLLK